MRGVTRCNSNLSNFYFFSFIKAMNRIIIWKRRTSVTYAIRNLPENGI